MLAAGKSSAPRAIVFTFLLAAALLACMGPAARSARADVVTVTGGEAKLTVNMGLIAALEQDNVFNVILPPATVSFTIPPVATFPITPGSTLEDTTMLGTVNLAGGIRIVKYNPEFTEVTHSQDSTNLRIVNGNMFVGDSQGLIPTPTGDFVNVQFSKDDFGTITYEADLQLNPVAAAVLNVLFETNVFQPNMLMGRMRATIATDANPAYPRPQAAAQFRTPLAIAYEQCLTTDRVHSGGLSGLSCSAATAESGSLTAGTGDVNGFTPKFNGFVKLTVCASGTSISGTCATPTGMSAPDVRIETSLNDVRCKNDGQQACEDGALSDYTGELQVRLPLRITDKSNGPNGEPFTAAATVVDMPLEYAVPCNVDGSGGTPLEIGGACDLVTSVNSLVPGAAPAGKRAVWETGQVSVLDGGPDGDVDTADNTVFARQGTFVP